MIAHGRRLCAICVCLLPLAATGIDTEAKLTNPAQLELYEGLIEEVRCLVCQNQTIGDSNAPLASDLRREIREMVAAGKTEEDIKQFLTERYGDFVLYRPRYGGPALLLWVAPAILLLIGVAMLARSLRRRSGLPLASESHDES